MCLPSDIRPPAAHPVGFDEGYAVGVQQRLEERIQPARFGGNAVHTSSLQRILQIREADEKANREAAFYRQQNVAAERSDCLRQFAQNTKEFNEEFKRTQFVEQKYANTVIPFQLCPSAPDVNQLNCLLCVCETSLSKPVLCA